MRKILLASAALVAMTGSAYAADANFQVSANVIPTCAITGGGAIVLTGTPVTGSFTIACNYNGTVAASAGSSNGGLLGANHGDLLVYTVSNVGAGSATSTQLKPAVPFAAPVINGSTTTTVDFSVSLAGVYADSYSDTLTISIAP